MLDVAKVARVVDTDDSQTVINGKGKGKGRAKQRDKG